jgi:hypothetical protein
VAGDVVADRLRHGLTGDLPPRFLQGWYAELTGKPSQMRGAGPGRRMRELLEQGHAPDGPVEGLFPLLPIFGK